MKRKKSFNNLFFIWRIKDEVVVSEAYHLRKKSFFVSNFASWDFKVYTFKHSFVIHEKTIV